jgi:5-methylcytosine-specific restriction endonuclease McrA
MEKIVAIPTAVPSTEWIGILKMLDLKNLTATAALNQTRTSGSKQTILDALTAKFHIYEAKATVLTNEALREVCKSRGIKSLSTLSKQELVGCLLGSNIHMYDVRLEQFQPVTGTALLPVFAEVPKKTAKADTIDVFVVSKPPMEKTKAKKVPDGYDEEPATETAVLPVFVEPAKKTAKPDPIDIVVSNPPIQIEKTKPKKAIGYNDVLLVQAVVMEEIKMKTSILPEKEKKTEEPKGMDVSEETKAQKKSEVEETKKQAIPKKVKTDVWNTFIGANMPAHKCLCCLKTVIVNTDFHVGHVTSEFNGGSLNIDNLRPICASCNYSMGTMNMKDYVIKFGYFF